MNIPTASFGPTELADLGDRTDYEAWLLEAVYEITDQRIAVENVDELIYPPSGQPPTQTIYGVGNITIGDWRPGFLEAGAPLVLVTAFKLLDMLLEWVLSANGHRSTHEFVKKIKLLKGSVQFPPLIGCRPWLRERLIALYEKLVPLRGTIIHERHFKSSGGSLQVSASKGTDTSPTPLQVRQIKSPPTRPEPPHWRQATTGGMTRTTPAPRHTGQPEALLYLGSAPRPPQ